MRISQIFPCKVFVVDSNFIECLSASTYTRLVNHSVRHKFSGAKKCEKFALVSNLVPLKTHRLVTSFSIILPRLILILTLFVPHHIISSVAVVDPGPTQP